MDKKPKYKLEVGEYIRTPYNKIEKIQKIKAPTKTVKVSIVFTDKNVFNFNFLKNNKVRHSFNIIDLIEVRRLCK